MYIYIYMYAYTCMYIDIHTNINVHILLYRIGRTTSKFRRRPPDRIPKIHLVTVSKNEYTRSKTKNAVVLGGLGDEAYHWQALGSP